MTTKDACVPSQGMVTTTRLVLPPPTDAEAWRDLVRRHKSDAEIGRLAGRSRQWVCRQRAAANVPAALKSGHTRWGAYDDYIPWTISGRHRNALPLRYLRLDARADTGGDLTPEELTRVNDFRRFMADVVTLGGHHIGPCVWDYRPVTTEGFWLVGRRPGDQHYARTPAGWGLVT